MDLIWETPLLTTEIIMETNNNIERKRENQINEDESCQIKRPKLDVNKVEKERVEPAKNLVAAEKSQSAKELQVHVHQSPKKRIEIAATNLPNSKKCKNKFICGNYSQYYGYRNKGKDFHDIRLDIFDKHKELFHNKDVLDIGCNSGFITIELAKRIDIRSIAGIDIDRSLINQANKNIVRLKKQLPYKNKNHQNHTFPYNVAFVHGNYLLRDNVLLEMVREEFDIILCLSVTKWIHLNFGDEGLKQTFQRMYLQLRSGGKLILEAQAFDNYGRRKKMTETIFDNYKAIQFFPKHFTDYLLSKEVGFSSVELMGVPENCTAGFKRPVEIFTKI